MLDENQNDGVYTSVGTYDHNDLIKLIVSFSRLTGVSIEDLQQIYGKSVFITLFNSMPGLEGKSDLKISEPAASDLNHQQKKTNLILLSQATKH
ncbi:heme NO-binding domain-containing protein [Shewanella sp. 10N.286.45.A1]|uniref:heme NO-binding domain-containing protein n=1 Tax=Shewanella sp. 10N.286.45.A1 TaxID=3229694 RepID=UPI00354F1DBF